MNSKFPLFLLVLAVLAQPALSQDPICGSSAGAKNPSDAKDLALADLAKSIKSMVSFEGKMEEIIIDIVAEQKDTTKISVSGELLNANAAKELEKGSNSDGYFSKVCMSANDAAKPYLRYLGYITSELEIAVQKVSEDACKNINDLYFNRIKDLEGILESLGQMDKAMQKRYDGYYEKIVKECGETRKIVAIYLDVSGSEYISEEELGAVLREKGCNCSIAENSGKADYVIAVKAKLNHCNPPNDFKLVYCAASANVSVSNAMTKKDISVKIPEANGGWTNGDTERAKRETFKKLTESVASKLLKEIEK